MDNKYSKIEVTENNFHRVKKNILEANFSYPCQHLIISGPPGIGKTTFVAALYRELRNSTTDFIFLSIDSGEIKNIDKLVKESLKNKRDHEKIVVVAEDAGDVLSDMSDAKARVVREFLQTTSGFIFIAVSRFIPSNFYDYSHPFYEFFKVINIKNNKLIEKLIFEIIRQHEEFKSERQREFFKQVITGTAIALIENPLIITLIAGNLIGSKFFSKREKINSEDVYEALDKALLEQSDSYEEIIINIGERRLRLLKTFSFPDNLKVKNHLLSKEKEDALVQSDISFLVSQNILRYKEEYIELLDLSFFLYLDRIKKWNITHN